MKQHGTFVHEAISSMNATTLIDADYGPDEKELLFAYFFDQHEVLGAAKGAESFAVLDDLRGRLSPM